MNIIKKSLFLIAAGSFVLAVGCGKKGPLILEPEKLPQAIQGLSLAQVGNSIKLTWTFPQYLSDDKTELNPALQGKVLVFHTDQKTETDKFKKKARILKKFDFSDLQADDNLYSARVDFSTKDLDEKSHYLAIQYYYGRKKSPISTVQSLKTIIPIRPIQTLSQDKEQKTVKLKWTKPALNLDNKNVTQISGFNVYRHVGETETKDPGKIPVKDFQQINDERVLIEYYEDSNTGVDGFYAYYVTTVSANKSETDPSNIVSVQVTDTFPPDTPANLVAFKAKDHVFITWEKVKDTDLSHYVVYRKSPKDETFKSIADKVTDNAFKDTQVKEGGDYLYYVTAVDAKGNESKASNVVKN